MSLRDYLGERNVEELIVKQFDAANETKFFSREEAEAWVANAFDYIEENNLNSELMKLDKRTICQLVYRIAIKPADEYLWEIQVEMGLAGKVDTPDGPLYYFTKRAEDLGERKAANQLSIELSKRRGISPLW
jgi:hypothetical protein